MLSESRPFGQVFVVALKPRMDRALDVDVEIAIENVPELYVGKRQTIASKKAMPSELRLGDVKLRPKHRDGGVDRLFVLQGRGCTNRMPEHRAGEIQGNVDLRPFGPFVDLGAMAHILDQNVSSPYCVAR